MGSGNALRLWIILVVSLSGLLLAVAGISGYFLFLAPGRDDVVAQAPVPGNGNSPEQKEDDIAKEKTRAKDEENKAAQQVPKLDISQPEPLSIKPPAIDKMLTVELKDRISDVAIGGGGRYMVLHLAKRNVLALFDVNEARVIHEFSLLENNVKFAAGIDKLIIIQGGDTNRVERWDLTTFQQEKTVSFPPGARVVKAACMGSASRGPVLVQWADEHRDLAPAPIEFVDLQTLEILNLKLQGERPREFVYRDQMHFRASPNGAVFGGWHTGLGGMHLFVVSGANLRTQDKQGGHGYVIPGSDGKTIYAGGTRFTLELQEIDSPGAKPFIAVPSPLGPYYLRADIKEDDRFTNHEQLVVGGLTVYKAGDDRPPASLPSVRFAGKRAHLLFGTLDFDRRITLLPEARMIVTIPPTDDQLVLHHFDVDKDVVKELPAGVRLPMQTAEPKTDILAKEPPAKEPAPGPALVVRVPIKPPVFDGDKLVVKLPAKIAAMAVGGGGRYLILSVVGEKKLLLFDINEGKIVHTFPVDDASVKFTSELEKLIVFSPAANTLTRWNLITRAREATIESPLVGDIERGRVKDLAMGSASQGPLLLMANNRDRDFVDLQTFKPLASRLTAYNNGLLVDFEPGQCRVSAEGSVFASRRSDPSKKVGRTTETK